MKIFTGICFSPVSFTTKNGHFRKKRPFICIRTGFPESGWTNQSRVPDFFGSSDSMT